MQLAVRAFIEQGRELYQRLRSSEGDAVGPVDLHILEVQMYLLDKEVARRKAIRHARSDPNLLNLISLLFRATNKTGGKVANEHDQRFVIS